MIWPPNWRERLGANNLSANEKRSRKAPLFVYRVFTSFRVTTWATRHPAMIYFPGSVIFWIGRAALFCPTRKPIVRSDQGV